MKPILLATAALLLAPVVSVAGAAQAQVAAGAMPNTFDNPNARAQAVSPSAPQAASAAVSSEPANADSEETLRSVIGEIQAGELDYGRMTEDLAAAVREQDATVTPMVQGFGAVVSVEFSGSRNGMDLFNVVFAEAATQWMIGINPEGKISALMFRPAE